MSDSLRLCPSSATAQQAWQWNFGRLALGCLGLGFILGCGDEHASAPTLGESQVHFVSPVSASGAREDTSALARRAALMVDSILTLVPATVRARMRTDLEDRQRSAAFAGSTSPEIARLGSILAGIRIAQLEATASSTSVHDGGTKMVRVTVALVPTLPGPSDVRAAVIRRPNDGGQPVLLLLENDLSARDLGVGLRAAAVAFKRYGVDPPKLVRLNIRATSRPRSDSRVNQKYIEVLRRSLHRDIPGVGTVRSTDMLAPVP